MCTQYAQMLPLARIYILSINQPLMMSSTPYDVKDHVDPNGNVTKKHETMYHSTTVVTSTIVIM